MQTLPKPEAKKIITQFRLQNFDEVIDIARKYEFSNDNLVSLKSEKFFLLSRWSFETSKFERFLHAITNTSSRNNLYEAVANFAKHKAVPKDVIDAINSALLLCPYSRVMRKDLDEIERFTKRSGAIKAILIYAEMIFANYNDISKATSVEVLASSLSSLLWMCLNNTKSYKNSDVYWPFLKTKQGMEILDKMSMINTFKEIELYPEEFGMVIENPSGRNVKFTDATERYKMYRYGFVSTQIHANIRKSEYIEKETFEVFAEGLRERLLEIKFIERRNSPDRYGIKLPVPLIPIFRKMLNAKGYFDDEINYIKDLSYELSLTPEIIEAAKPNLDIFGLMKINRLLSMVYSLYYKRLFEMEKNEEVLFNSLVFDFDASEFRSFMKLILGDKYPIVEGMIYKVGDSLLDIEYTPFIQIGERIIPLFITAHCSDTVRNFMRKNRVRLNSDGSQTPLEDSIKHALEEHGISVLTSITIDGNEKDVLFKHGATSFILECKNNLIGTSIFETRTLMDYLDKAADQLDQMCESPSTQTINGQNYFDGPTVGVIVLGNRLFSGYRYRGYKVVFIRDLISFIEHDQCEYVYLHEKEIRKFPYKKRGQLTESCLRSFLTIECQSNVIEKVEKTSKFGSMTLSIDDYDIVDFNSEEVADFIERLTEQSENGNSKFV